MNHHLSPPKPAADRAVSQFTRQLIFTYTLRCALSWCAAWGFVWGSAVLLARWLNLNALGRLGWGALGWALAIAAAYLAARRQQPAPAAVRALLDQRNAAGGLLMAEGEQALGAWVAPAVRLPAVRGRFRAAWMLLGVAVVFVALAFALPLPRATDLAARPLDVARETAALKEDIAALQEAEAIQPDKAETLAQQMQQLQQNAAGDDPARTWEALDQLREALAQTAQQSAETAAQQQQQLAQAAALAEALQQAASQLDEATLTAAMREMTARAAQAAQQNAAVAQNLSPALQQALKDGKLNPQQLKELAQALQKGGSALSQRMSKLAQAAGGRMINPNSLPNGAVGGERGKGDLAEYLKKNAAKKSVSEALKEWSEGGQGGVDRGRGDAELTWSDGTREDGAKFKEKTLPTAALSELQNSELIGLSSAAPASGSPNVAAHGALNGATAGGGSAYTQPVLPRHKGAVRRYFDRAKK